MRNRWGKFRSFLLGTAIPFITVLIIVTIALIVYVGVNRVSDGDQAIISLVMLVTIVMLSLCYTVGNIIRKKITVDKPVDEILNVTKKIAAGDFSARVETLHTYDKYNDYDLIMENVNAMAAALEKSETVNTDFIANVSHELKTPLAIIQNHVERLNIEKDENERKKCIDTVISATKRLSSLVTNMLKLNKLENQEIGLEFSKIALHDMLAESVLAFEGVYEKKNIELECDFDEVEICSEKSLLDTVWNNLLSNAVKFTDEGGKITVTLKKEGNGAVVSVKDTGCGISPEIGGKIFDKFYQGDTSHAVEGNGLGLALVKRVIDLIGGKITVKSQLNVGTTFTVTLKDKEE